MSRGEFREVEDFPKKIKIFFIVILILLVIGTFGFMLITNDSIKGSFFRTIETMAFIFNDESTLYERGLEIFLAIFGVFLVWWVLWSIADMLLDGNLRKYLKMKFYITKVKNMKNHTIIIGGGRVGEEVAKVMNSKKKDFVMIESDLKVSNELRKKGFIVIQGDAMNEEILKKANIKSAGKMIITMPKTESNIVITLTAKEMNSNIEIHSRCENPALVSKLKRAGAKVVIVPEILAADKMAEDLGL